MDYDKARDYVIDYLLTMQRQHPTRHIGFPKPQIVRSSTNQTDEYKASLSLAIDYLTDEDYLIRELHSETPFYRLSSKAQNMLLPSSKYQTTSATPSAQSFNNYGVILHGDNYGEINNSKRVTVHNDLEKLADIINQAYAVNEDLKNDHIQNILTLQAQLKREKPDKSIMQRAWQGLSAAATISGAGELIKELSLRIGDFI